MQNNGRHVLDIFRNLNSPPGIKLLMGLLKYNPDTRWTAEEALAADYFSTMVGARQMLSLVHISRQVKHLTFHTAFLFLACTNSTEFDAYLSHKAQ